MTHIITLPWPRPPLTANDQRRSHWTQVRYAKSRVENAVAWQAVANKLPRFVDHPVDVAAVWFPPDRRRRDADSLAPLLKAALDGLVLAGVLPDDNSRHVASTVMSIEQPDANPRIEIRIEETP